MKTYGLETRHLDLVRKIIDKAFSHSQVPKVYLFGSRAVGTHRPNSDIDLALKGDKESSIKIAELNERFENSDLPYKVDLLDWNEILPEYKPSVNKQKKLIWSPEIKEKTTKWRPCPIGEHWVRRHDKKTKSGKVGDWDGHCRKNRSGKDILKGDEIEFISESEPFKKAKPKARRKKLGFDNGNKFDSLINGWTAYWNAIFKLKDPLHPNHVKALIATESGFNPSSKANNRLNVGRARGVVQLTEQTQKILKDRGGELKNHFVVLNKTEIWEANKNIAAAIRWLFRKREILKARKKSEPTWEEVVFEYKGISRQKGKQSNSIRRKYREYFRALNE